MHIPCEFSSLLSPRLEAFLIFFRILIDFITIFSKIQLVIPYRPSLIYHTEVGRSLTWESPGGRHQALLHARRVDDVSPLEDAGVEQRDGSGDDGTGHAVGEHAV